MIRDKRIALGLVLGFLVGGQTTLAQTILGTQDVLFGPGDPATQEQWQSWHQELLQYRQTTLGRIGMSTGKYEDAASRWSDGTFRHLLLFMYDQSFIRNGKYRTAEWLRENERRLGHIDAVILWQAYPQLGLDSRTQFDFYRQMPGGLRALRTEVSDVLHTLGVRVFLDFNPWDRSPEYNELAAIVADLDADGIMLDTLNGVPTALQDAVARRKRGVVLSPERRPSDEVLPVARNSWAQWFDIGTDENGSKSAIYRLKWILPQHLQLATRRWDTDRRRDIVFSFFNGSGLLLWDNVFGTWNPYSSSDRRLLAETATVLNFYRDLLVDGEWSPLMPTGVAGLDMNCWRRKSSERSLCIFRNRTDQVLRFPVPPSKTPGLEYFAFWNRVNAAVSEPTITIPPQGVQALALDSAPYAQSTFARFQKAATDAAKPEPAYDTTTPIPALKSPAMTTPPVAQVPPGFSRIPGGQYDMVVEHQKRECGCYPFGASVDAMWGWYYLDPVSHHIPVQLSSFAIKTTAVTNSEYLQFVLSTGYHPSQPVRFLKQIPRLSSGVLPSSLSRELGDLPVTYISLGDARAYAKWKGERLPTEAEWQWVAQGAQKTYLWPWGDLDPNAAPTSVYNHSGHLKGASDNPTGATPQGVLGLSGNAWEFTQEEWSDGHNRFVMLRGGTYLPLAADPSEWMLPRGPHANTFHAKYLLLTEELDRSEAISFRTVLDF